MIWSSKQKESKNKQKNWKLKISDMLTMKTNKVDKTTKTSFTAACKKLSKWAIEEKLLIGAKFPLYLLYWECLDMEKQNKLLQDTYVKILLY